MKSIWKINKFKNFYLSQNKNLIQFNTVFDINKDDVNINKLKKKNIFNKNIKISKEILGSILLVYNGHRFIKITIKENKTCLKKNIGMFIFTRKMVKHPSLKKDQKKK